MPQQYNYTMKTGRPSEYKPEFCQKVDEYLATRQDEEIQIVKQSNSEKGYEMYETKMKVKLPTLEGFAVFLGITRPTLYEWEKLYPEFSYALGLIRSEQQERLVDRGLSNDYNSTIAKLVLSSNHGMREKTDTELSGKDGKALFPQPIMEVPAKVISTTTPTNILIDVYEDDSNTQDTQSN